MRAAYLWHWDRDGWVEFISTFPGAYDGRWPHFRFEVKGSLETWDV